MAQQVGINCDQVVIEFLTVTVILVVQVGPIRPSSVRSVRTLFQILRRQHQTKNARTFPSLIFPSTMLPRTFRVAHSIVHRQCRWLHVEMKLKELGIELPPAPTPKANYNIVCHASGNMLYISRPRKNRLVKNILQYIFTNILYWCCRILQYIVFVV